VITGASRESWARGRRFLTGHDDRSVARPRRSLQGSLHESSTLPNRVQSAGDARRTTARMCAAAHLSEDTTERAVLLTSELVTNALLHSGGEQRFTVTTQGRGVRVEVGDDSRAMPVLRPLDDEAEHGRGAHLLDTCSSSWGARRTSRGKCVWFQITDAPV
jgi:anti-sigma regulatory factor (Ser/Thr protein kinase)